MQCRTEESSLALTAATDAALLLPDFSAEELSCWQPSAHREGPHSVCKLQSPMHAKIQTQKPCLGF